MINRIKSKRYEIIQALERAHLPSLSSTQVEKFDVYIDLIMRWNDRTNLTAIREVNAIIDRHLVECISCAHALPHEIPTLLDFGSGAGFPGIPIALCRPEIAVTLAESQGKKAAFLQEAARVLGLAVRVHAGRAEDMKTLFDCVAMRAVDRMQAAIIVASMLVRPGGWLAILTTDADLAKVQAASGSEFDWPEPISLPGSNQRMLALGRRNAAKA